MLAINEVHKILCNADILFVVYPTYPDKCTFCYKPKLGTLWVVYAVLIGFLLTVKAATLIFISGRGSAISSAKQGKSGSIYNMVKN